MPNVSDNTRSKKKQQDIATDEVVFHSRHLGTDMSRRNGIAERAIFGPQLPNVFINELLCLNNAGSQISMFFTKNG